ncbi:MAG: hypothetical protein KC502_08820 [Myxococcales bacterium]|nr:hypothetical protein [Myxococcales bacterium]
MSEIPAATVVLLRAAHASPEVFLIRRHGKSGFMAGATVFPGGKVDLLDADADSCGRTPAQCAALLGVTDVAAAHASFVAAVRELHEEAHVVLARDRDGNLPSTTQVEALNVELDGLRQGHRIEAAAVHGLWRRHGLRPALDLVAPFAWWVTPTAEPRRFDTRFFVGIQPPGQRAAMDGFETTAEHWCTARQAVTAHEDGGEVYLPPPTLHTLQRMAQFSGDAQAVFDAFAQAGSGPRIQPFFVVEDDGGPVIAMPDDALHPAPHGEPQTRNRFVLRDGRFQRETSDSEVM